MKTVDILTPQNVKLEMSLASTSLRIAAFALDQIVFIAILLIFIFGILIPFEPSDGVTLFLSVFILYPIIFFYSLIMELLFNGQSVGKMILKLRVIRLDGEPLGVDEALSRWFLRLIDIYLSLGSLAVLMTASNPFRQRFGDVLGGTIVIVEASKLDKVSLKHVKGLDTTDSYQPVYPSARLLSEDEAMIIKKALVRHDSKNNDGTLQALKELTNKLEEVLEIKKTEKDYPSFLRTVLKDYVVMTR